jgi:hypothetical protein
VPNFVSYVCVAVQIRADIGGIPLWELNALELRFLFAVDFDLNISPAEYARLTQRLLRFAAHHQSPAPPAAAPDAAIVTTPRVAAASPLAGPALVDTSPSPQGGLSRHASQICVSDTGAGRNGPARSAGPPPPKQGPPACLNKHSAAAIKPLCAPAVPSAVAACVAGTLDPEAGADAVRVAAAAVAAAAEAVGTVGGLDAALRRTVPWAAVAEAALVCWRRSLWAAAGCVTARSATTGGSGRAGGCRAEQDVTSGRG